MKKAIFWDFDGTLIYSNESFLDALDSAFQTYHCKIERNVIKDFLISVCSWYMPQKVYVDKTGELWWEQLLGHVKIFCNQNNIDAVKSECICKAFRNNVVNYEYRLYADVDAILQYCKEQGYQNYLLSNNFPELVQVVERFGLEQYFEDYFLSANIGYEKPRREIFGYALNKANSPDICYMIGDNPIADIQGAQAVGIKTILVHKKSSVVCPDYCCEELSDIKEIIIKN